MAAVPLPGIGSPIGGIMLYLDETWVFDAPQRRLLEATARRTADAVRRVRAGSPPEPEPTFAEEAEDADRAARVLLDDDPRSVGLARRFLREMLEESEVSEDVADTAQLCLSELVTNAVVHAGDRLRAARDPRRRPDRVGARPAATRRPRHPTPTPTRCGSTAAACSWSRRSRTGGARSATRSARRSGSRSSSTRRPTEPRD